MIKKNILSTVVLVMLSGLIVIQAQDAIQKYFTKYADDPSFTTIVISEKMFQLFANLEMEDGETKDVQNAINGLTGIKILAFDQEEDEDVERSFRIQDEIRKLGKEYELLMSVDENDEKIRFYIVEEGSQIKELFMMVGGNSTFFMMSLMGDIDLESVAKLSGNLNISGVNYLDNLEETK